MLRYVTNVVLMALAIALLGVLVLLSTTADDRLRRQADLNLRQLRDVAAEIEREALDARNLKVDNGPHPQGLGADMHARIEAIGRDLTILFPVDTAWLPRLRGHAEGAFNSID